LVGCGGAFVAVGGSGVGVGASRVSVGGAAVGGTAVGGTAVSVGGTGVFLGSGVSVGRGVSVGIAVGVGGTVFVAKGVAVNVGLRVFAGRGVGSGARARKFGKLQLRPTIPQIANASKYRFCLIACHPVLQPSMLILFTAALPGFYSKNQPGASEVSAENRGGENQG
jgi:hypothetical protein